MTTSTATDIPKKELPNLEISLKFLSWQSLYETEKPFHIFLNIPSDAPDQRNTNLIFHDVHVPVRDIRSLSVDQQPTLDHNGFIYRQCGTSLKDFADRTQVENVYLPEIELLLRTHVEEIERIFFFDWRLRVNAPEAEGETIDMNDLTTWLRPALHVHIDQSSVAVLKRVQLQLGDDAESLLQGRVRVINVWRPLITSIEDWPLAICDGSTVDPQDLVEADHIRRHYTGSMMYLKHNPDQRFYYMSKQSNSDVLIFKNFDSTRDLKATYAPHASFHHPNCPEDAIPRQSIEVRALVFSKA